jgi:hypothetical protein
METLALPDLGLRNGPAPFDDPTEAARAFAVALLAGDVRGATRCFDSKGAILTPDHTAVTGHEGIAEILAQLVDSQIQMRIRVGRTVRAGPVALATQTWDRAIAGKTVSSSAELVLLEVEGHWAIFVAAPWGRQPRKERPAMASGRRPDLA